MTLDIAGCTHVGLKRSENQDQVFVKIFSRGAQTIGCLAVADGMGGHEKGADASNLAIATIQGKLEQWLLKEKREPTPQLCIDLEQAAHRAVKEIPSGNDVCGSTLSVALLVGDDCIVGHVGDSRVYTIQHGRLAQLTEDQTWEAYSIKNKIENQHGKALLQAVGVDERIVPEAYSVKLAPGDWVLVCSDGLYKMVENKDVEEAFSGATSSTQVCEKLLELALSGGGRDNVGICVARCSESMPSLLRGNPTIAIAAVALVVMLLILSLIALGKI
ncbi:MAG: protein phosphatase 2C domain-containing protein [Fimbriimonas sp.]|nr:protein phosphatase 2C domain-containing protein [Fimbriimonas sp.]